MPRRYATEEEIVMEMVSKQSLKISHEIIAAAEDAKADKLFQLTDIYRTQMNTGCADQLIADAQTCRAVALRHRRASHQINRTLEKLKDALSVLRTPELPGLVGGVTSVVR